MSVINSQHSTDEAISCYESSKVIEGKETLSLLRWLLRSKGIAAGRRFSFSQQTLLRGAPRNDGYRDDGSKAMDYGLLAMDFWLWTIGYGLLSNLPDMDSLPWSADSRLPIPLKTISFDENTRVIEGKEYLSLMRWSLRSGGIAAGRRLPFSQQTLLRGAPRNDEYRDEGSKAMVY